MDQGTRESEVEPVSTSDAEGETLHKQTSHPPKLECEQKFGVAKPLALTLGQILHFKAATQSKNWTVTDLTFQKGVDRKQTMNAWGVWYFGWETDGNISEWRVLETSAKPQHQQAILTRT